MKNFVWVSFDLGVKGDYEGMYAWLAKRGAKECGDSLACFWYDHPGDLLQSMKDDLNASIELDAKKSRIYLVRLVKGKMRGSFIFGHRRIPPWAAFAEAGEQLDDASN